MASARDTVAWVALRRAFASKTALRWSVTGMGSLSATFQILPLLAASHAIQLLVRLLAGGAFPGLGMLLAPLLESLLWPVVSVLLLLPQRRTPNPDAHRPL